MLIKIGDCWIDPTEIVAVRDLFEPVDEKPTIAVWLRNGESFDVEATMDEAEAALIDAGVIENEYGGGDPGLSDEELAALAALDAEGFEWLARDDDGKLYAFRHKPVKDGAYWDDGVEIVSERPKRIEEGFDFINARDDTPWSIAYLQLE